MSKANPVTGEIVPVGDQTPVWSAIKAAATDTEKAKLSREALQLVTIPDLARPTPMFFVDLPWAESREDAQDDILARLIAAEDMEAHLTQDNLVKLDALVGHSITIHSVVARKGTMEDAWGAYASLDVTVDGGSDHKVVNTSAKEVCVITWRAYVERKLPFTGRVILKGNPTPGRDQPIGLIPESKF